MQPGVFRVGDVCVPAARYQEEGFLVLLLAAVASFGAFSPEAARSASLSTGSDRWRHRASPATSACSGCGCFALSFLHLSPGRAPLPPPVRRCRLPPGSALAPVPARLLASAGALAQDARSGRGRPALRRSPWGAHVLCSRPRRRRRPPPPPRRRQSRHTSLWPPRLSSGLAVLRPQRRRPSLARCPVRRFLRPLRPPAARPPRGRLLSARPLLRVHRSSRVCLSPRPCLGASHLGGRGFGRLSEREFAHCLGLSERLGTLAFPRFVTEAARFLEAGAPALCCVAFSALRHSQTQLAALQKNTCHLVLSWLCVGTPQTGPRLGRQSLGAMSAA